MTDEGTYPLADEPPPSPPSQPPPVWADLVPGGPTCRRCGYELKGLPMKGQCPECALPVARSLRGNLLEYSDPAYVGRLASGALLVELAIVGFCAVPIGGIAALVIGGAVSISGSAIDAITTLGAIVSVVASIFGLLGLFVLTSRDPAFVGPDESDRSRLATRWATLVCAASWACAAAVSMLPTVAALAPAKFSVLMSLSTLTAVAALWVQIIASLSYLRHLAARFPDSTLKARIASSRKLAVIALACTVVTVLTGMLLMGCVGLLVGLVSLVLLLALVVHYAHAIDAVRRRLASIARAQANAAN